jgi:hypothetical protein
MVMRRRLPTMAVVLAALAAPACGVAPRADACTLIGCEDGWNVELAGGTLPATYTLQVRVQGAVVASVQCSPANPCGRQVFLPGVTAEQADLEIIGGDVPLRWTVRPEYRTVQPNGPSCPPACRQARVRVEL